MYELWHCDTLPVMSIVTSLMPIDDVNVDDSIVSFTDDGVTSMTYIVTKWINFKWMNYDILIRYL